MEQIKYRYSALYEEIIDYPELGRFRRYTEEWTWILYDGSAEIRRLRQECDDMIATIQRQANRTTVFTVTDVHQNDICKEHPELSLKMDEYKEKIRQYTKDLLKAHAVIQLPDQPKVYAKYLAEMPGLFGDDVFGPTGESAGFYRMPVHPDTCGLKGMSQEDILTEAIIHNVRPIKDRVLRWIEPFRRRTVNDPETPVTGQTSIELDTIRRITNVVTGLWIPTFFTASMVIVFSIHSVTVAFAVALVLGLVLTASVLLVVPKIVRGELFAITASYYAVVGIFIGATKSIAGNN